MKKRCTSRFAFSSPRALTALFVFAAAGCLVVSGTLPAFFLPETKIKNSQRTLTFGERVAYQRAIEEVYWRHRIWPKERSDLKPSLDAVMPQAQIEKKVADNLRKSQALGDHWRQPITAEQLQAEMDRMAKDTKQPKVLQELFQALGNDPFLIAECLARPTLAERLFTSAMDHQDVSWAMSQPTNSGKADRASFDGYTLPRVTTTFNGTGACVDAWAATSTVNAPTARDLHTAVWTGSEMIVWGGTNFSSYLNTGGRYNPSTDSWTATSTTSAPSARARHTAVWTGSEMIVWGGSGDSTGGKYNPMTDSWTATSTSNAPSGRSDHTAVWTGSEMIVWGGGNYLSTGGKYNPGMDTWAATNTVNAPAARRFHSAVWTGSEMIVWGGFDSSYLNTGGRYNPGTDSWTATNTTNAPTGRVSHTAVWTDSEMIVWGGGISGPTNFNTGGRYNPGTDSWTATSTSNAPSVRVGHAAVWTGGQMVVWGGITVGGYLNTGGRYNPTSDTWIATSTSNAPSGRYDHTAVWTSGEMIAWGGIDDSGLANTGGRYCGQYPTPTPTPTASPTPTATPTSSPTPTCEGCSVSSPNCGTTVFSPPTDFTVNLNPPGPAALQASDLTVNGIPADSFMIVSGGAMIHFYFNTSPAVPGENTIHIAACAFFCGSGSVQEFTCTFLYESPTPTPTPTATAPSTLSPTPTPTPTATATPRFHPTPHSRPSPPPHP